MNDFTDPQNENLDQEFPLNDQKNIEAFQKIVVHHISEGTYGNKYSKTASHIMPNDSSDAQLKKVKGQLKRLVHQKTLIRDKETLSWLWSYFMKLDRWKPYLLLLNGQSATSNLALQIFDHETKNNYIHSDNNGYLPHLIESGNAIFFQLKSDEANSEETNNANDESYLLAYKFFFTENPHIFKFLVVKQGMDFLNNPDEKNYNFENYESGHLVYDQWEHMGSMIYKNKIEKIFINSRELLQVDLDKNRTPKDIYNNYHEPAFFVIDNRERASFIVNNSDDLDAKFSKKNFKEAFYTINDMRLRLGSKRILLNRMINLIDKIDVDMI